MPPLTFAGAAPSSDSPFGALADPQQGADQVQQQTEELLGQIRDLMGQVDSFVEANPMFAQDGQQVRQILRGMVVKLAKQAPTQTSSSEAVPPAMG